MEKASAAKKSPTPPPAASAATQVAIEFRFDNRYVDIRDRNLAFRLPWKHVIHPTENNNNDNDNNNDSVTFVKDWQTRHLAPKLAQVLEDHAAAYGLPLADLKRRVLNHILKRPHDNLCVFVADAHHPHTSTTASAATPAPLTRRVSSGSVLSLSLLSQLEESDDDDSQLLFGILGQLMTSHAAVPNSHHSNQLARVRVKLAGQALSEFAALNQRCNVDMVIMGDTSERGHNRWDYYGGQMVDEHGNVVREGDGNDEEMAKETTKETKQEEEDSKPAAVAAPAKKTPPKPKTSAKKKAKSHPIPQAEKSKGQIPKHRIKNLKQEAAATASGRKKAPPKTQETGTKTDKTQEGAAAAKPQRRSSRGVALEAAAAAAAAPPSARATRRSSAAAATAEGKTPSTTRAKSRSAEVITADLIKSEATTTSSASRPTRRSSEAKTTTPSTTRATRRSSEAAAAEATTTPSSARSTRRSSAAATAEATTTPSSTRSTRRSSKIASQTKPTPISAKTPTASSSSKKRRGRPPRSEDNTQPKFPVGTRIAKPFWDSATKSKLLYGGAVERFEKVKKESSGVTRYDMMYFVRYDDGDEEHFSEYQMGKHLVSKQEQEEQEAEQEEAPSSKRRRKVRHI